MTWGGEDYLHDNSRTPLLRTSHFSCKFNLHFSSLPQYLFPPYSHLCSSYSSSYLNCPTAATVPGHLYHYQCRSTAVSGLRLLAGAREFANRRSIQAGSESQPASRGNKADHSHSSSAAVNNAWSSASTPLCHHENVLH